MYQSILRAIQCAVTPEHLTTVEEEYADQIDYLCRFDKQSRDYFYKPYQAIREAFFKRAAEINQEMEFLCLFNRPLN